MDIGGLAGNNGGNIYQSSSKIKINFNDIIYGSRIGGFVGYNDFFGNISGCNANVDMKINYLANDYSGFYKYNYVGGFTGSNHQDAYIGNSYTIGAISYIGSDDLVNKYVNGGFVGNNIGRIDRSYCAVNITSNVRDIFFANGGFAGSFGDAVGVGQSHSRMLSCYYDKDVSSVDVGIGHYEPSEAVDVIGLTSDEMRKQSNFKDWNFEFVWKLDEGKNYPELRRVANNDIVFPDNPVNPGPDPKPDPNPEEPDNPDPKPDTPDTPDNPDVPVNPDPKPDTPDNPDKPVNPDPKPDTPITPEQPSHPGTNPGGTPSQPSTKPDTKPDSPGTNQPVQPETPVVPEHPSNPVQPENPVTPEQPSNPGTTPGGNTPSQPDTKPETPVTPNLPSNPGNNSGSNNNANSGTTQFPTGTTTVKLY